MATERLSMRKIREILRHKWALGRCHRDVAASLGVSLGAISAAEQRARDAEPRAALLDRQEVLLRERLGRRHQGSSQAVLHRAKQRVERHDRLARAHVALEEPLHRYGAREIGVG